MIYRKKDKVLTFSNELLFPKIMEKPSRNTYLKIQRFQYTCYKTFFHINIIYSWRCIQQISLNMPLLSIAAIYFSEQAQGDSMWSHISLDPTFISQKWGSLNHLPIITTSQDGQWLEQDNGKSTAHLYQWTRYSPKACKDRWLMWN